MADNLKVALCQLKTGISPVDNLRRAGEMIATAAKRGVKLVVLPEMFIGPYVMGVLPGIGREWYKPAMDALGKAAARHRIWLVGGSLPEPVGKHFYNTAPVFNPSGKLIAQHRKVHLFSVRLPSVKVREGEVFKPGNTPTFFIAQGIKMGVAICFDVRFPEFMQCYGSAGVELLCIPGAFTKPTGEGHWHVAMRSRAIDQQLYVAAASPAPDSRTGFTAYGHSLWVNPWGEVEAEAGEKESIIYGVFDRNKLREVRNRLPIQKSRRPGIY
jgi:predicted amidohydrolase